MIRVYSFEKCSTCKKALKWLEGRGIEHEVLAIKETPVSDAELDEMLAARNGDLRKLFNTSGMAYREEGFREKMPEMEKSEAFQHLQENGMLVKRPFLIGDGKALLGFREEEWTQAFS